VLEFRPLTSTALAELMGLNSSTTHRLLQVLTQIGYIARDHWLKRALLEEGKGCSASIGSIGSGGRGLLGVVLDVRLEGDELGERGFVGR